MAFPQATVGIVTCGKAHYDLMEVLRRLEITPAMLAQPGVRLYKVGWPFPLEPTRMRSVCTAGCRRSLVVEEKAPVVEVQLRDLFYNAPAHERPLIRRQAATRHGAPLVSATRRAAPVALDRTSSRIGSREALSGRPATLGDHLQHVRDFTPPELLSNAGDRGQARAVLLRRLPAQHQHQGARGLPRAQAGIGCHFMAAWMGRETEGVIQMGGEGVDWVSPLDVHQGAARVSEPGRRHLLALGPIWRFARRWRPRRRVHLQDPVQRCGGDDRRPAGRRRDHGRPCSRARSRARASSCDRPSATTSLKYDSQHVLVSGGYRVSSPRRGDGRSAAPGSARSRVSRC